MGKDAQETTKPKNWVKKSSGELKKMTPQQKAK